jgi:hypothetical protein
MDPEVRNRIISEFIASSKPTKLEATRDRIISEFIESSRPTERECRVCGKKYVGVSIICDSRKCFYDLKARADEERRLRPIDYQAITRPSLFREES